MSSSDQAQEPTMEEILASIRRIISDDTAEGAAEPDRDEAGASAGPERDSDEPDADDSDFDLDALSIDDDDEDGDLGSEDEDVLELTDVVAEGDTSEEDLDSEFDDVGMVDFDSVDVDIVEDEGSDVEFVADDADDSEDRAGELNAAEKLTSSDTDSAVAAAFGTLASTLLARDGTSRTLEDLVQELLRPMLKSWLDENLPAIVEDLVRQEIERVARRAGR